MLEHGGVVKTLIMNLAKPLELRKLGYTGDNYFSDISKSRTLLKKQTTYVGTSVRSSRTKLDAFFVSPRILQIKLREAQGIIIHKMTP